MLHIGIHLPGVLTLALAIRLPGAGTPSVPPPASTDMPIASRGVIETQGAEVIPFPTAARRSA
jgi:hypothetical protein